MGKQHINAQEITLAEMEAIARRCAVFAEDAAMILGRMKSREIQAIWAYSKPTLILGLDNVNVGLEKCAVALSKASDAQAKGEPVNPGRTLLESGKRAAKRRAGDRSSPAHHNNKKASGE